MKKIIVLFTCCVATSVTVMADSKLNGAAENLLYQRVQRVRIKSAGNIDGNAIVDVLALLKPESNPGNLGRYGACVNWFDGEIASLSLPVDSLVSMSDDASVVYVEYTPELRPMLNFARQDSYVDAVQTGFDFAGNTLAFTGRGVLTGLMDNGIDPNHINFTDDAGESRVKAVFHYQGTSGLPMIYTTSREIRRFTSDNTASTHGTHVAGIMAGAYDRSGKFGWISSADGTGTLIQEGDMPYYGVAVGSDIAMAAGPLTQGNIVNAITNIFDLAENNNQPCVINLSFGNNAGPHDGTDLLSRSVATQAKRGIITVSAGNEGDYQMYMTKVFSAADNEIKTFIQSNIGDGNIEVWGDDANALKVIVALYANAGGVLTEVCSVDAPGQTVSSSSSSLFKTSYSGSIAMTSGVSALNNRYNVTISMNVSPLKTGQNLAVIIQGKDGQSVNVYGTAPSETAAGVLFSNNRLSGWTNGACDGSINSLACADGVISVGAYTTRTTWPLLNGQTYGYTGSDFSVGSISPFSSWGQKFGGGWLPDVCAPGANIISSFNTYYVTNAGSMCAQASAGSKTYYWGPLQGTSMSSPFVAGVIALWLEANPALTASDVMDVINATSIDPSEGTLLLPGHSIKNPERWGAGKIDALAGIKKVLEDKASVGAVFADDERNFIITPIDGGYNVYVAGENALTVGIHDMSGRLVAQAVAANDNNVDIATSQLPKGIYVVTATGNNSRYSRKIAL